MVSSCFIIKGFLFCSEIAMLLALVDNSCEINVTKVSIKFPSNLPLHQQTTSKILYRLMGGSSLKASN
jgi:hypothetical protein